MDLGQKSSVPLFFGSSEYTSTTTRNSIPNMVIQTADGQKYLKPNLEPDHIASWVKEYKVLWDKTLEFRFLLQKAFSSSNRLPQDPIKSSFCDSDNEIKEAYLELIASSKKTLDSFQELQEALFKKNLSITQGVDGNSGKVSKHTEAAKILNEEEDQEWLQISQMHSRNKKRLL